MKRFYPAYSDEVIWPHTAAKMDLNEFLAQLVPEIPWGHHRLILDKHCDPPARIWYLHATVQLGWSRRVLLNQIKTNAYERSA